MEPQVIETTVLAAEIAKKVIADTSFWVGVVGFAGVVLGAAITVIGNVVLHKIQDGPRRKLDDSRKELPKEMLKDSRFPLGWRKLSTLARVVGADDETTKRLLFEIGARGSEKDDGMWGLIGRHPLTKSDE